MAECFDARGKRIILADDEFIASGGQGTVYGHDGKAYKIYHDLSGMIPVRKIEELQVLDLPNILGPKDVLYDRKGKAIGFTMPLVNGAIALCRLFVNGFRRTKGFTPEMSVKLVEAMIGVTQFIHDKHCLVADGNEFNYLVDCMDLLKPYFIDVDNYSTPDYPAQYLNPSVRDYQTKGFSVLTDWYALAIVACQIFIGLHPFKGSHPQFDTDDLEGRMMKNVSIFNKDVSVPPPTRDYSNIPTEYHQWFIELFEKGKRLPPPKVAGLLNVTQVQAQVLQTTLKFITALMRSYGSPIVRMGQSDGRIVVITENKKLWVDNVKWDIPHRNCDVVFFDGNPIIATIEKGLLKLRSAITRDIVTSPIAADQTAVIDNILYVKRGGKLIEIGLTRLGSKIIVTLASTWKIMPLSSELYDNVVLQNMLGKMWIVIPRPGRCYQLAVPELDGVKIVAGKRVGHVCMFTGYKKNKLTSFMLFFNDIFDKYTCAEQLTDDLDVNFTVLPNKVTVKWDGKRMHIIYPNLKVEVIEDKKLPGNMTLKHLGDKLLFFVGEQIYHITIKK